MLACSRAAQAASGALVEVSRAASVVEASAAVDLVAVEVDSPEPTAVDEADLEVEVEVEVGIAAAELDTIQMGPATLLTRSLTMLHLVAIAVQPSTCAT